MVEPSDLFVMPLPLPFLCFVVFSRNLNTLHHPYLDRGTQKGFPIVMAFFNIAPRTNHDNHRPSVTELATTLNAQVAAMARNIENGLPICFHPSLELVVHIVHDNSIDLPVARLLDPSIIVTIQTLQF